MPKVVTGTPRISSKLIDRYKNLSVATVHEAQGRSGLLSSNIRPIKKGLRLLGRAVTVLATPGDNIMIHVAIEQCEPGDVMVVGVSSRSDCGYFGDLLATLFCARGVSGLVIDAGVRDLDDLQQMKLPVFSRCVSAQGTVKETLGDVNIPIVCGGQVINPSDLIIGDDDGVVVVRKNDLESVAFLSEAREEKEASIREKYREGILGLDMNNMRQRILDMGLQYVAYDDENK